MQGAYTRHAHGSAACQPPPCGPYKGLLSLYFAYPVHASGRLGCRAQATELPRRRRRLDPHQPGCPDPRALLKALLHPLNPNIGMTPPEAAACAHACSSRQQAAATPAASSEQTPSSSGGTAPSRLERPKSARRRAAEALLHRRFSGTGLASLAEGSGGLTSDIDGRPTKRQRAEHAAVQIAACSDCCVQGCRSAAPEALATNEAWCAQDVSLPPVDWPAVLQAVTGEADVAVNVAAGVHKLPGAEQHVPVSGLYHPGIQHPACMRKVHSCMLRLLRAR